MNRKVLFLLLVSAALLFSSCILLPGEGTETNPATERATASLPTEEPTSNVTVPSRPLWLTDAEALAAAEEILLRPSGGVVDVSRQSYTYSDMETDLQTLSTIYSKKFSYRSIGQSVAGREIYVGVLGNPSAPRQVVVSAAIHAREYMTAQLVMKQLEFYLRNYEVGVYKGMPYSLLFEQICFYIVPMSNPDGVMLSQEGLDSLPKELRATVLSIFETEDHSYTTLELYLSHWKANARGVDLNRNYDALWESYENATAPASSQYKGPSPASEPETQALISLIKGLSNPVCTLCIHSQGEVIYWNCGQSDPDRTLGFAEAVARRNGYEIIRDRNNDASLSDWCELEKDMISITVETGNEMCPLPIGQFSAIWRANFDLLPLTALYFFEI